ncbi:MAG: ArsR/SmtB family transcription factor [Chloroflexota bacterium]
MKQDLELPKHRATKLCCGASGPRLGSSETAGLAKKFKAVADPTRLAMLDVIAQQQERLCVCDITAQFPQNQPTISHHLKMLREAGMINTERRGIWSYFWPTDEGRRFLEAVSHLD